MDPAGALDTGVHRQRLTPDAARRAPATVWRFAPRRQSSCVVTATPPATPSTTCPRRPLNYSPTGRRRVPVRSACRLPRRRRRLRSRDACRPGVPARPTPGQPRRALSAGIARSSTPIAHDMRIVAVVKVKRCIDLSWACTACAFPRDRHGLIQQLLGRQVPRGAGGPCYQAGHWTALPAHGQADLLIGCGQDALPGSACAARPLSRSPACVHVPGVDERDAEGWKSATLRVTTARP